jgi:sterol 3beta-glucosyltransferase
VKIVILTYGLRGDVQSSLLAVDQPFWGGRVKAIGAGPAPIPIKRLSEEKFTEAIFEAGTNSYRERADSSGRKVRNEGVVNTAMGLIKKCSNEFHV